MESIAKETIALLALSEPLVLEPIVVLEMHRSAESTVQFSSDTSLRDWVCLILAR